MKLGKPSNYQRSMRRQKLLMKVGIVGMMPQEQQEKKQYMHFQLNLERIKQQSK